MKCRMMRHFIWVFTVCKNTRLGVSSIQRLKDFWWQCCIDKLGVCHPNIYVPWSTSELRVRLARRETGLSPPEKYFTDRSKAVFLLWIFYVFVLSCVCYVFVHVCLYVLCGHLLGKGWPLGSFVVSNCEFVTFPLVSWVRCGTWLYRFLIFAPLLTSIMEWERRHIPIPFRTSIWSEYRLRLETIVYYRTAIMYMYRV